VLVAVAAACAAPTAARAATYCVHVGGAGCQPRATAAAAFAAANASRGPDTILLGRLSEAGAFADATGEPVRVVGAGRGATVLRDGLELTAAGSSVSALTVRPPAGAAIALAAEGSDLDLAGPLRLGDGAALLSSLAGGPVATRGRVRLESVAIGGPGLAVETGALTARHLTVLGSGPAGIRVAAAASATVSSSVVWGFERGVDGARVTVSHSHLPEAGDPGFAAAPGDLRPRPDSPLVDAGDPAPLAAGEPQEDALGDVRAVDGDGDGFARRDIGALERRPPPPPATAGNVLVNPGAEQGAAVSDDTSSPAPPGWRRTGGFTSVRYGTVVAGNVPFPSLAAADALGAGGAFFAAGPSGAASAVQVADVSALAPEIDGGKGSVRLSALLGGYRMSTDHALVSATFRGPSGGRLGALALPAVTHTDRAQATMLLARAAVAPVPPLTRTIAVALRAGAPGGRYNDAYVDDVALIPAVAPLRGVPAARAPATGQRRFAGVQVIARRARVGRGGRARVRLACPSATAGRCAGVVTLLARGGIGAHPPRARFRIRRGRIASAHVRLPRPVRRALDRRMRGRVYLAARDRRGLTRTATAPVRIVRRRR